MLLRAPSILCHIVFSFEDNRKHTIENADVCTLESSIFQSHTLQLSPRVSSIVLALKTRPIKNFVFNLSIDLCRKCFLRWVLFPSIKETASCTHYLIDLSSFLQVLFLSESLYMFICCYLKSFFIFCNDPINLTFAAYYSVQSMSMVSEMRLSRCQVWGSGKCFRKQANNNTNLSLALRRIPHICCLHTFPQKFSITRITH